MKSAETNRTPPWRRAAALVVGTLSLALGATGCGPECTDSFDCRNEKGEPPPGEQWVCRDEKCETVPVQPPPTGDAGTDAGVVDAGSSDAGSDAGSTDSGTEDAGSDAGAEDAGTDAGPEDAGGPDAGPEDAGSPDAGPEDAGSPDAGPEDAGSPDAGPEDAGSDPCAIASHDPKLGTLSLQPGFEALESAPLPDKVLALTASPGPVYSLHAVRGAGMGTNAAMYSLGTWPDLQPSSTKLYDIVSPQDRAGTAVVFAGGYMANDGSRLFAGYTTSGPGFPGSVAVYDFEAPAASTYVSAPSNFTAVTFSGGETTALLVNGAGLGTVSAGLGIYALVTSTTPFTPRKVASFATGEAAASGFTAVSQNGIALFGFASSADFSNRARVVARDVITQALTSGTPVDLGSQQLLTVGSDFNAASAFGSGVVVKRGGYNENFEFVSTDVSRYALAHANEGQSVTVGERTPVLVYADQCTSVVALEPLGSDLLVGVSDKNGRRLVRIRVTP
ncbi:hypothetical protein [Pyxidicoccus xibeiensis]|uniref:hypothetical protein n=1 Tax=Pyxidicoccus xibeiensis TaxID=2906759 RepID=UPI0020A7D105|nr:hypothetical protein [Pyxidicoccus xibeiensis]MCP3139347.1 hypothetical protein [Pyxidicoccus xibeiensis]